MKKTIFISIIIFLTLGCYRIEEVKVIGYNSETKATYEHWVYERIETGERFVSVAKYGNIGETIKIKNYYSIFNL